MFNIEFNIYKMSNFLVGFMFWVKGYLWIYLYLKAIFPFEKHKKPDLEWQHYSLYSFLNDDIIILNDELL